jgi:plastocyanin
MSSQSELSCRALPPGVTPVAEVHLLPTGQFDPRQVSAHVGQTVSFFNDSGELHFLAVNPKSDQYHGLGDRDPPFDIGDRCNITFPRADTYVYYLKDDERPEVRHGEVTVTAGSSQQRRPMT